MSVIKPLRARTQVDRTSPSTGLSTVLLLQPAPSSEPSRGFTDIKPHKRTICLCYSQTHTHTQVPRICNLWTCLGRRVVVQRWSHSGTRWLCVWRCCSLGWSGLPSFPPFLVCYLCFDGFFKTCAKGLHGEGRQPRSVPLERALLLDLREKE